MRVALAALLLAALPGCVNGLLYTHTIRPLSTDFRDTPVVSDPGVRSALIEVRYSFLDVRGGDNAIGGIARQNGLTRVHYAEIETWRILGVFTQTFVRVYGERDGAAKEPAIP